MTDEPDWEKVAGELNDQLRDAERILLTIEEYVEASDSLDDVKGHVRHLVAIACGWPDERKNRVTTHATIKEGT